MLSSIHTRAECTAVKVDVASLILLLNKKSRLETIHFFDSTNDKEALVFVCQYLDEHGAHFSRCIALDKIIEACQQGLRQTAVSCKLVQEVVEIVNWSDLV